MSPERHQHHILFSKNHWNSTPETKTLRQNRSLIVPLELNTHNELHREIVSVPLPSYHIARRVAREFMPYPGDELKTLDQLMSCFDTAITHPRCGPLEAQLGGLIIESLYAQRKYLVPLDNLIQVSFIRELPDIPA